jgi:hypothetical protein
MMRNIEDNHSITRTRKILDIIHFIYIISLLENQERKKRHRGCY